MNRERVIVACMVILGMSISLAHADNAKRKMLMNAVDYGVKPLETKGKAGMEELKSYRFAE
jgi:hypothetical protein